MLVQGDAAQQISEEMMAHVARRFPDLARAVLARRLQEFLKFLKLCSVLGAGELPVAPELDDIWHTFILETRAYAELCDRVAGRFVHHTARVTTTNDGPSGERRTDRFLACIVAYVAEFGRFSTEVVELWPAAAILMKDMNLSLDELNELAEGLQ